MKRYSTKNYILQHRLAGIDEIKIVEKNTDENNVTSFTFEFDDCLGGKVHECVTASKNRELISEDKFKELKDKRKQLIDEYFKKIKGEDNE